jgi:UDP-N-acetylglucosamine acyltransferase
MGVSIHATAIVEKGAFLGNDVNIGPYSFVGKDVVLGDRTKIYSHAVLKGHTSLGNDCTVWPFATLGTEPQDLKYQGEESLLVCGDENSFREYCNVSIGTALGSGKTSIGSRNLFMIHTHIAHDCVVGNSCVFANGVSLGGHVVVGDYVILGGHSAFHQFTNIGSYSISGGGSVVVQDVLPCSVVQGNHAKPFGINKIGLERNSFSQEMIASVRKMYKIIYRSHFTLEESICEIHKNIPPSKPRDLILNFLSSPSARGLVR